MRALRWLVVGAWCCGAAAAAAQTTVRVGLESGPDSEPRRVAAFGGEACPSIGTYPLDGATRPDAELLLCNALRVSGPPVAEWQVLGNN